MSIDVLTPEYGLDCFDCQDYACDTDTCKKLFAIGPCSTIQLARNTYVQPPAMVFDPNTWCRVLSLNNVNFSYNTNFREKGYVGERTVSIRPGKDRPTITVSIDFCKDEPSHIRLTRHKCKVAWMMMDDRADYVPNAGALNQPCLRYGLAIVDAGGETAEFDTDDTRSITLRVTEVWWELNFPDVNALGMDVSRVNNTVELDSEA